MSNNKVEMSLDDIIKASKNKDKLNRSAGGARKVGNNQRKSFGAKAGRGIQKRGKGKAGNIPKRRVNNFQKSRAKPQKNNNSNSVKAATVATKKLVQRLVKKALAQRAVRNNVKTIPLRKRGGVRSINKTVVLNRVNPNSRVINRRRNISMAKVAPLRKQIRYTTIPAQTIQYVSASPVSVRRFVRRQPKVRSQPIIIQQTPMPRKQQRQVYQWVPVSNRRQSVRSQINAMRRQVVYVNPQQNRQNRPQFRQNVQKVAYVQQKRFQGKRKTQQRDVFFEPQNFLQRIPVQQTSNRRFAN